jgi:hypothetical protein
MSKEALSAEQGSRLLSKIRRAVADYMASEGCSCCQNTPAHEEAAARLGRLLWVPEYEDGSGYDFAQFRTPTRKAKRR